MSNDSAPDGASLRTRRKALGWSRRELARRAALDPRVIQLLELDQWTEGDAIGRVRAVLLRAESGESDVTLPPIDIPADAYVAGAGGPIAEA